MKITIYTVPECPFSKSEKEYLSMHGLAYEEKNVQENRAYLSEMLEHSDKFAGVPFTTIIKDDGSEIKLRGFTKSEFDAALSIDPNIVATGPKIAETDAVPTGPNGQVPASIPNPAPTTVINPTQPAQVTSVPTPPVANQPTAPSPSDELKQVMTSLDSLTQSAHPDSSPVAQIAPTTIPVTPPVPTPTPQTTAATPTIPDLPNK